MNDNTKAKKIKKVRMSEPIYKTHYWLCEPCANKFGGKFPERHIFTVTVGECKHCHEKDVTLIPWVDFNWPNEKTEHLRD